MLPGASRRREGVWHSWFPLVGSIAVEPAAGKSGKARKYCFFNKPFLSSPK